MAMASAPQEEHAADEAAEPRKRREQNMAVELVKVVLGGAAGLGLGCLVIAYFMPGFFGGGRRPPKTAKAAPIVSSSTPTSTEPTPPVVWKTNPEDVPASSSVRRTTKNRSKPARPLPSAPQPTPQPTINIRSAPAQPQPTIVATPKPLDPLASLPAHLPLPVLATGSRHELAKLNDAQAKPIELHLKSKAADIPPNSAIFVEAADAKKRVWNVFYAPNLAAAQTTRQLLGIFDFSPSDLGFRWQEPPPDVMLQGQLSNCMLEARSGDSVRAVALRAATMKSPLVLDMNKGKDLHEFSIDNPPQAAALHLEVTDLRSFPSDATFKGGVKSVPLGQELTIEFTKAQGAEISIKFARQADGDLTVLIAPEFREGPGKVFELTYERLETTRLGVEAGLARARGELAEEQRKLSAAQSAVSSLNSQMSGANFSERNLLQQRLSVVQGQLKRAANRVSAMQKQIPDLQARQQAVPAIKKFLDSLHQRGELRLQIYAACLEHKLILLDARQPVTQGAE